ncbi:hypothetical protein DOS84_03075 [Flavobacterium aquariorum]|uniref:Uncharacterized protein n=1 Tax=Flavobacterium aquariorum TaxID=2217670 RepID=A0A2W7TYG6_9FLAO|nr:hypothetical protein DOS84_03075 [Flavobacterium aquariorum]
MSVGIPFSQSFIIGFLDVWIVRFLDLNFCFDIFLAPIEVEILFIFPLKIKRLQRIAGLAPENYFSSSRSLLVF